MNVVLLHYHLRTGGVTTVLRQQLKALNGWAQTVVLCGEAPVDPWPVTPQVIPGLAYDEDRDASICATDTAKQIDTVLTRLFPDARPLVHVHNPTLAKNHHLPKILHFLQQQGYPLFLQIHDFAEDGRPSAFFHDQPYLADCHYGVINARDHALLLNTGLVASGLHLLPNMVSTLPAASTQADVPAHVLYPVRAIRRKNIGEALLLSTLLPDRLPLYITRPPSSSADRDSYRDWQKFVKTRQLPVLLEAGLRHRFSDLVHQCRFMLTTSIAEGFGFCFLEPWTAGKMLYGRRLESICTDFQQFGVHLDHLYPHLKVPLRWLDVRLLQKRYVDCLLDNARTFRHPMTRSAALQAFDEITTDDLVDMGLLDETLQRQVILQVLKNPTRAKERLAALNPLVGALIDGVSDRSKIAHNGHMVANHYAQAGYRQRLLSIYRDVLRTPVKQQIERRKLLTYFFEPARFSLLKWREYVGG